MSESRAFRFTALVRRELQEYRSSLCWTPLVLVLLSLQQARQRFLEQVYLLLSIQT